jgi:pimeloyl-ACP methyl ester carboxylesterase
MSTFYNRTRFVFSVLILMAAFCLNAAAQSHITGTLPDGATYVIDVPEVWNKTLLLYSHGYVPNGYDNPAWDVGDGTTGYYLLNRGYALAGSSYSTTGWSVHEAIPDQIATLDVFQSFVGTPARTIAWGHSLGGMITAGLVQEHPERFSGALPMCGLLGGGVGVWNQFLDSAFALNTLIAGGTLQLVNLTDPGNDYQSAAEWLGYAQSTPQGQARTALIAALGDVVGWWDAASPEPAPTDYATQEVNQFYWLAYVDFYFTFYLRAELEGRAGGSPSWNTGVDYRKQLKKSAFYPEVQALYAAAGLSLDGDLVKLQLAPRIPPDPGAVTYLSENIIYNGQLGIPVLTLQTTGDGLIVPENDKAYKSTVHQAHNDSFLAETFVHRAGHCTFTPAETIIALEALNSRLTRGKWKGLAPSSMNKAAASLGPGYNFLYLNGQVVPTPPAFEAFRTPPFLRPFDAFSE